MTKEELKKMFSNSDWNEETIIKADEIISKIAKEHLGLDVYPNQFEIVTSEQMLDAYSLIGLPISYGHWKFGKDFVINQNNYKRGRMGLAYELVINSNPCISYNMEDNTTCLMLLVLAHAAYGHNHFFKNNYLFKLWTHADSIIDYMLFARNYIAKCEEKYGYEEVENILDCCHVLMNYGVDKYKKPRKLSSKEEEERFKKRIEDDRIILDDIWRTLPSKEEKDKTINEKFPKQPEENILYFLEKNSPSLKQWQREIVRIVRKVSQYFYPQGQSKVINEGCATFSHYEIINKMYEDGYLDEGFMQEFYHHHSNVIFQPDFDSKYYSGLNPYTLGFNIFSDIKRMSLYPTEEDKRWFPDIAGKGNWKDFFVYIVDNFKDESFVLQYLSPKVIRDMKLFSIEDNEDEDHYKIEAIHDDEGYRTVRKSLADNYNRSRYIPEVQVYDVDVHGDRTLTLSYTSNNGKDINLHNMDEILRSVSVLWGFDVRLIQDDDDNNLIWDYSK